MQQKIAINLNNTEITELIVLIKSHTTSSSDLRLVLGDLERARATLSGKPFIPLSHEMFL